MHVFELARSITNTNPNIFLYQKSDMPVWSIAEYRMNCTFIPILRDAPYGLVSMSFFPCFLVTD